MFRISIVVGGIQVFWPGAAILRPVLEADAGAAVSVAAIGKEQDAMSFENRAHGDKRLGVRRTDIRFQRFDRCQGQLAFGRKRLRCEAEHGACAAELR